MDHIDAESAERVSGMATPLPNGIVQTIAATIAAMNVKNPNFLLEEWIFLKKVEQSSREKDG